MNADNAGGRVQHSPKTVSCRRAQAAGDRGNNRDGYDGHLHDGFGSSNAGYLGAGCEPLALTIRGAIMRVRISCEMQVDELAALLSLLGRVSPDDIEVVDDQPEQFEIDWSEVPAGHDWVAKDENGLIYSYRLKPSRNLKTWNVSDPLAWPVSFARLDGVSIPQSIPWNKSLFKRPT